MKHERTLVGLWRTWIRLYVPSMKHRLYNLRLLGDARLRDDRLDVFLDSVGASMDMFPVCKTGLQSRGADALWTDFVRISEDVNRALNKSKNLARLGAGSTPKAEVKKTRTNNGRLANVG